MCGSAATAAPDDRTLSHRRNTKQPGKKAATDGDRRFSFILHFAVAGPPAAFGHHPFGRGVGAGGACHHRRIDVGPRRHGFRLHRGSGAGAVAIAQCRGVARRRSRRQSGGSRRGPGHRRRHAGSGGAARPRRPRPAPQCGGSAARAGAAQERTGAVRVALARDYHRAARSHRHFGAAPHHLSRPRPGRSLDGADRHAGAGADAVRRHRKMHADDVP